MASPDSLVSAIQSLHMAMAEHKDPQAKQVIATCLASLMKVQAQDHAAVNQVGAANNAVVSRLGGAY